MRAGSRIVSWLAWMLAGGAALGLLVAPLGAGYFSSRLNFTYGARGLDPSVWGGALLEISALIAAGIAFEFVMRRGLLEQLRARIPLAPAVVVSLIVVDAGLVPLFYAFGVRTDVLTIAELLLYENLLQLLFIAAYLASGSFLLSGLIHGTFAALRFTLINDVSGPFETLFFYSYSDEGMGWALTLSPILGSLLMWGTSRLVGARMETDQ